MTDRNSQYADETDEFANGNIWQLTHRELQSLWTNGRFWIGFVAVIAVLAISGPFDTQDLMLLPQRFLYWSVISIITFFPALTVSYVAGVALFQRGVPEFLSRFLGAIAAGALVTLIVWFANIHLFAINMEGFWSLLVYCTGITIAVVMLFFLVQSPPNGRQTNDIVKYATAENDPQQERSAFFDRLEKQMGRDLISIQAQDHYLNVRTTKGAQMVLMRLSDACAELDIYPGSRVHRSWWVGWNHVSSTRTESGSMQLLMSDGTQIPVSRSHQMTVREWQKTSMPKKSPTTRWKVANNLDDGVT